jgi:hypothetical protein
MHSALGIKIVGCEYRQQIFSRTCRPLSSVRGAACITLQMLSRTRESGSLVLFGGVQRHGVSPSNEIRGSSRLIQEPESGDNKFAMQFQEFQQLDVDVLVDYYSVGSQYGVPRMAGETRFSAILNLDSCGLKFPSFQKCGDISPSALRLCFLLLLERPETLHRQPGLEKCRCGGT